ncbi:MAG: hypothetical protein IPI64_06905 [Chloracidobacterium sp.]|nr:hypothetical protein [Chloracidobacterium sp.]
MGRKILAVVVALIVSFGIMMIVEMINTLVVMPPSRDHGRLGKASRFYGKCASRSAM